MQSCPFDKLIFQIVSLVCTDREGCEDGGGEGGAKSDASTLGPPLVSWWSASNLTIPQ